VSLLARFSAGEGVPAFEKSNYDEPIATHSLKLIEKVRGG
jgi:hypothetical protein